MASAEAKIKIRTEDLTKKGISTAKTGIGKLTQAVKAYGAELAVVILAARKMVKVVQDLTKAYIEDERANAILNSTLKATGIYTEKLAVQLKTYAREMQNLTTFSKAQIMEAQGIAATFTEIGTEIYPEVIESAMDMSTVFGGNLKQAMVRLGKVINDPRMAASLREIGITMSESQMEMIKWNMEMGNVAAAQRIILDELQLEMGETAEAIGKTFGGQVKIATNLMHEWKAAIGGLLAEQGQPFIEWLIAFLKNSENLQKVTKMIQALGTAYAQTFGFWLNYYGTIIKSIQALIGVWKNLAKAIWLALNPKNWGKGEIKAALDDIKTLAIDTVVDISKGWSEWVAKTGDAWKDIFGPDISGQIETFGYIYQAAMQRVGDATTETFGDAKEAMDEFDASMVLSGEKLATYISGLESQWEWEKNIIKVIEEKKDSMEAIISLMIMYSTRMYDMGVANELYLPYIVDVIEKTEDQLDILRQLNGAWVDYKRSSEVALEAAAEAARKQQETMRDLLDITYLVYGTMGQGVSQYYANASIEAKNWYAEQKKSIEANITDEEARAEALAALDEQMAAKESAIRTNEAQAQKKMAIFGILINTARGIAEAFPKFWKMAAIGAMGAVQMAIAQSAAIPTYQEGGIVPGGYGGGDTVPALLEPGEMVIRKEIVREAQQGGGGQPIMGDVYFDGYKVGKWMTQASRNKQFLTYKGAIVNV